MRYLLIMLALAAYASPAAALNPQPLPPGIYSHEPPDPCVQVLGRHAHARCVAQYQLKLHNHGSGGGAGKIR